MTHAIQRVSVYFFVSFIGTGIQNIVPQYFFTQYAPHTKAIWLSTCLVLGSVGSISIIWWMNHSGFCLKQYTFRTARTLVALTFFIIFIASQLLFTATSLWLFIVSFIVMRASTQFLINILDNYYIASLKRENIITHSKYATLLQLIGIMLAPIYFAATIDNTYTNIILLSTTTLFIFCMAASSIQANYHTTNQIEGQSKQKILTNVYTQDILFLIYAIAFSSAAMLSSSNMIYLISDYYQLSDPVTNGAVLLFVINLTASITVFFAKKKEYSKFSSQTANHVKIATAMLLGLGVMLYSHTHTYKFLTVTAIIIGRIYGFFLLFSRQYAVSRSISTGHPWIISIFNNHSSYAIVLSSMAFFLIAMAADFFSFDFTRCIIAAIGVFMAISTVAALCFNRICSPSSPSEGSTAP